MNQGCKWVYGSSKPAFWLGAYEAEKQELVSRLVKPGMVVWDVGANVGFYTLAFSRFAGAGGKIFAFEPLGANFDRLLSHIRLNGLTNVTAVQAAVASSVGLVGFDTGPNALMGRLDERLREYLIPTLSADSITCRFPDAIPTLVKIDVEGAEAGVLEGADKLLSEAGPDLLLALHGREPEQRCRAILAAHAYECFYLDGTPASETPFRSDEILARKKRARSIVR
jgi:FkbM family methyltransferase